MATTCRPFLAAVLSALALGLPIAAPPAAAAPAAHAGVVGERPVDWTPHVLDGRVKAITRVGDTVYVGGSFQRVASPDRSTTYRRSNLFAFEHGTGRVLGFSPDPDNTVASVVPADDGVYIGGSFTRVGATPVRGAALVRGDGRLDRGFDARISGGSVYRLARHGDDLYAGGSFSSAGGGGERGIARLDARTGAADGDFSIAIGEERRGSLRVQDLALSPDGGRLVIAGTFMEVEGRERPQIAMVDTASSPARLSRWSTDAYAAECDYSRMHTYMRQIDFAPDGSYFAVVTAGGPHLKPGLCKTVARWEAAERSGARPTWTNHTGGDSLYAVAATGAAVYAGGHQRWMDNPEGDHEAGPGAVEREGIAAVDPRTGRALPWNPGRSRGHGVEALTPTEDGLYVGSDTTRLGGEDRARVGMFPLD
ncbi:hypothetical protein [Nocardiopsis suaedae]|uniref:PKD domain containing protein n=1 Tax=Nocardiopsis suaedae TaxID=3018444 RepID=A0ABT4TIV1_9ACTN|nr:hypothetical protein [Nocardiopsis suaedae]MDA2804623.1 hypothetical protein [Nocardiopsis suaedae]